MKVHKYESNWNYLHSIKKIFTQICVYDMIIL